MRILLVFSVVGACLGMPSVALATSGFPMVVRTELGLNATPSCALCHATSSGGGAASKPFGVSIRAAGAAKFNEASLKSALAKLAVDKTDSDRDGVADVDELKAGTDPNGSGSGGGATGGDPPSGCAFSVYPTTEASLLVILASAFAAAGWAMRRRSLPAGR